MSDSIASVSLETAFRNLEVAGILDFVTERRREDLTLDFKRSTTAFAQREDRRTLATSISGFANSAGGLIVWGIDAKPDPDGIDCAQRVFPITEPELFMSRLVSHAGAAVSPVVDGVEHRLIEGAGGPFAVTYVPESRSGPHMAKLGEDRYYKRSGDRFMVMEHFDIADMFGRRRRPVLKLSLDKQRDGTILVMLRNEGRGVAKAPYLALELPAGFESRYGFDGNGTTGLAQMGGMGRQVFYGGDANKVIHVGQTLPVTRIAPNPFERKAPSGPQAVRYEFASEDFELVAGEIVFEY